MVLLACSVALRVTHLLVIHILHINTTDLWAKFCSTAEDTSKLVTWSLALSLCSTRAPDLGLDASCLSFSAAPVQDPGWRKQDFPHPVTPSPLAHLFLPSHCFFSCNPRDRTQSSHILGRQALHLQGIPPVLNRAFVLFFFVFCFFFSLAL